MPLGRGSRGAAVVPRVTGRPGPGRGLTLALLLALVALFVLVPRPGRAQDVIWKTDGGKLRGRIVSETRTSVVMDTPGGRLTVRRNEIARIEREADVLGELEQRRGQLTASDLRGWYDLGVWCQGQGLYPQAIDCFHEVLRIEPDHADARFELGYRRHEGRWVTESEYFEARGYERWEDRWVTPEEREKLEAGLVQVDGRWVTRESLEAAERERAGPARDTRAAGGGATPTAPAADERRRRDPGNAWGGRPQGGQAGGAPLSPEERAAQVEQEKQKGGWAVAHSSKYYDFYSNGPRDEVLLLARTMDLMCDEFKKVFQFEQEITRSFPVWLYGSQQEFMSRTGHGPGTGGFYDGRKIVGFHGKSGGLSTQGVLFHEGTHQFQGLCMGQNMWRAKIWLIEGLAVFFEASEVQGRRLAVGAIPKDRLAHVKRAISSNSYVPLRDLIRMDQAQFGALHYAHAWSLIYFLVNGTQGGKRRFVEYWERAKLGEAGVPLFEELFDRPIEEIEAAWKQYVLQLQ